MTTNEPPAVPEQPQSPTSGLPSYGSVPPPSDVSYPPPPGDGYQAPPSAGGAFSASDAIRYGWKKFRENAGPILLAALLLIVASAAVDVVARAITGTDFNDNSFSIGGSIAQIITSVVSFIIGAGITRGALDITEGRKFDLMEAFRKLNLTNVIITSLIVAVLTAIGFALLVIPGLIVAFFTIFAIYFVVDKDTSPVDSVKASFNLIKANAGNVIVLMLLSFLVVVLGFLALCVGVFVALPVIAIAWAYSYKTFLGEPVAP